MALRHRRHPPGTGAGARSVGGREHLPSANCPASIVLAGPERSAPRTDRPARLRHRPGGDRRRPRRRPPAGGRDRQGAVAQGQDHRLRRADRRAVGAGRRAAARHHRATCAREGVGIVYISHRLDEVFRIADRMTVMKDGAAVGTVAPAGRQDRRRHPHDGRPTAGGDVRRERASAQPGGGSCCAVENLNAGARCANVSFSVRAGEIVGLGGLVGSGRTEVARLIFGADRLDSGRIFVEGKDDRSRSPARRGEGRHRAGAGGPQAAGRHPRQADPGQRHHGAAVVRW